MSLTYDELSFLENGVLDATTAYVDARLSSWPYNRTEIGVIIEITEDPKTKKKTSYC